MHIWRVLIVIFIILVQLLQKWIYMHTLLFIEIINKQISKQVWFCVSCLIFTAAICFLIANTAMKCTIELKQIRFIELIMPLLFSLLFYLFSFIINSDPAESKCLKNVFKKWSLLFAKKSERPYSITVYILYTYMV